MESSSRSESFQDEETRRPFRFSNRGLGSAPPGFLCLMPYCDILTRSRCCHAAPRSLRSVVCRHSRRGIAPPRSAPSVQLCNRARFSSGITPDLFRRIFAGKMNAPRYRPLLHGEQVLLFLGSMRQDECVLLGHLRRILISHFGPRNARISWKGSQK